jgi:hypothetical protein
MDFNGRPSNQRSALFNNLFLVEPCFGDILLRSRRRYFNSFKKLITIELTFSECQTRQNLAISNELVSRWEERRLTWQSVNSAP